MVNPPRTLFSDPETQCTEPPRHNRRPPHSGVSTFQVIESALPDLAISRAFYAIPETGKVRPLATQDFSSLNWLVGLRTPENRNAPRPPSTASPQVRGFQLLCHEYIKFDYQLIKQGFRGFPWGPQERWVYKEGDTR